MKDIYLYLLIIFVEKVAGQTRFLSEPAPFGYGVFIDTCSVNKCYTLSGAYYTILYTVNGTNLNEMLCISMMWGGSYLFGFGAPNRCCDVTAGCSGGRSLKEGAAGGAVGGVRGGTRSTAPTPHTTDCMTLQTHTHTTSPTMLHSQN